MFDWFLNENLLRCEIGKKVFYLGPFKFFGNKYKGEWNLDVSKNFPCYELDMANTMSILGFLGGIEDS